MTESAIVTVCPDPELNRRLGASAQRTGCDSPALAAQAIALFLELQARQMAEIEASLEEADAGDFASEEEVEATFRKWDG